MFVTGGMAEKNIRKAGEMIERAARGGCHLIVLPECLDFGYTFPDAARLAEPVPGKWSDALSRYAADSSIYVVAGLTERESSDIYNAAVLISPEGCILLKHRKINILEIAQDIYSTGDVLRVVKTPLGVIGVDICADNFPESLVLGHSLARMGAQILLSPCAWAVKADYDNTRQPYGGMWRKSYRKLASLYDVGVVGVSNVGQIQRGVWKGRKCIGCSLAVGPGGTVLAEGPYGEDAEELLFVEISILKRSATGTALTKILEKKGYRE